MKLNPQQAPLCGDCVLTVQLDDDDMCRSGGEEEEEEEVEFYLLFSGSTQRHLTSTLRVSHVILQATCPAHNLCEQVLVTLCLARPGGAVDLQSQETFCFVQDLALDMAHFLLVNTAQQETPPMDDEQVPLKEFQRLDQSLALALKHLTLSHQRPAPRTPSLTQTDVDKQMAVSQCQQLSSLLQLAASQSLRTVGSSFREASKKPTAQGLTPACLGESTGHQQLVELFTQDETSSCVQVEPKEQLHFNPKGWAFQQHANLGTYTLTFPGLRQREGLAETPSSLQEEVEELRRLIYLDRHKKRNSNFACTFAPTHGSTSLSIDHMPVSPACGLEPLLNCHPESRQDAVLAAVTVENCSTTKEQASPPSLEKRTQVEDSAVATQTSCTSGSLCQSQEAGREQKGTPAANSPAGRNRKNKKRTTKTTRHAKESPANSRITPEAGKGTAQRPKRTTGSKTETDETISPREPQLASVIVDRGAANSQCSPSREKTLSPIKPMFAPGCDGKYSDRKSVALPTTVTIEKQEGQKWEVDLLICEQVVETETVTETEQGDTDSFLEKEATCNLALESAAERTVTMGQEQSNDPHERQSDPEEQSQPDTMSKSPQSCRRTSPESLDTERKPWRGLWRDGGLGGGRIGSSQNVPEIVAKTVWYQVENLNQDDSKDLNRKELKSQSVWYDCEKMDHRKHDQLEQEVREQKECVLSSPQASGLSSPQLLEQGLSFHQLSAALSQTHAAGTLPALSHGPGTQRQEEHGSQQEEEVWPDWREGGVEGDGDEVSNRETTCSRKSFETASVDEGGEEKKGSEEKSAKGRKKRRKKRGKRGVTEAKLSSSSSVESQSQIEIQTQGERVTNLNTQSETKSDDKDKTGRVHVQSPSAPQPTRRGKAVKDAMHLPSQTKNIHGPDCDVTNSDPSCTTPEFSLIDYKRADLTEVTAPQTLETKELSEDESMNFHGPGNFNSYYTADTSELEINIKKTDTGEITSLQPTGKEVLSCTELELRELPSPIQQTVNNVESVAFSKNEDLTVAGKTASCVDGTGLEESNCPKELPLKLSDSREFTVDSFLMEFPEQNTQHVQSTDKDKPVQLVDPLGRPGGFMESMHPTEAQGLPFEGTVDVSPLQREEGRAETTQREYLEHCSAAEMLRDQQPKEEERNELWMDEEEVVKERSWERRSEKYTIGMVHGREISSIDREKKVEDEKFPSLDREKEQKYNEDLVATAVAVVTVAIASAMSSIELSQRLGNDQVKSQEYACKELANDQPLEQDISVPTDTLDQLADNLLNTVLSTQVSAQLMDKENCQLLEITLTEMENQPTEHLHIEPTDHCTIKEQAKAETSKELQSHTETEMLQAAQLSINQPTYSDQSVPEDSPNLPHDKEEIQTELQTQNKLLTLCSLPKEEDRILPVHMKSFPEANEIVTAKLDSQGHMQTKVQMQEVNPLSCLAVDTGQYSEASDTLCPYSKETPRQDEEKAFQNQSTYQKDIGIQAHSGREHLVPNPQHSQTLDKDDSHPVGFITAADEEGMHAHEQCKTEGSESCENGFSAMLGSDCQAKEHESEQWLDGQVKAQCEGETATVQFSPVADPSSEKPTDAVNVETGEYQSTEILADIKPVPAIPFDVGSQESVAIDKENHVFEKLDKDTDTQDTVDGWKERQRIETKREEQARKEMVTVEDTCLTETETFPAAKEENQQIRRDSDSKHTPQIKREKDVFYPVQPCLDPNAVTTCTDIHPDKEECVSVCLLHTDKDNLKVGAEGDDSVFKKPEDPPPCFGHKDRGVRVSCSSTDDDALIHGGHSPSGGGLSLGRPEAVAPLTSRLSWKSEMEDREGGETEGAEGGGEEEEKKDKLLENPVSSAILRASIRSLSPFRRHSWEPGRNNATVESDMTQRSSLKSLPGEVKRAKPPLHRRSMSWCPSSLRRPDQGQIDNRSYSLEGLEVEKGAVQPQCPSLSDQREGATGRSFHLESQERGSLVSLTEEEQEGDGSSIDSQTSHQVLSVTASCPAMFHHQTLTKSISMVTISHRDIDVRGFPRSKRRISFSLSISPLLPKNRRFFSIGSFSSDEEEEGGRVSSYSSNSGSLEYSISEEEPGPLRSDNEGKGGPKISRTFSYLRSKMSKKGKANQYVKCVIVPFKKLQKQSDTFSPYKSDVKKEKEKERRGEKERESKEREKKSANGHVFIPVSLSPSTACQHCNKLLHSKDTFLCNNCGVHVHKCCRESLSVCTKSKTKQHFLAPEAVPGSAFNMRSKSTSSTSSVSSTSSCSSRERWSTVTTPDDQLPVVFPWRHPSTFNPHGNLAKSISISNIAGLDDVPLKGLKFRSQSTDSLHQGSKVNASTESLIDEGTEMMDSQLMGEFECDIKDLEADSWSGTVDKKFLKALKKDEIKRQDVIYELYQTEFHHVRTLKIMSEVYYKGLQKELQLDTRTLDKIFPVLDELLDMHTHFLTLLLERKRASSTEGQNNSSFLIRSIGDVLVNQFSGCTADSMKKVYGKFCSRHHEAVNLYKDLHAKDKRFQAFIKTTMSSSIVRRLSIPECILLVTQRITKYPVLIQRILQHTKDSDEDHSCVCKALHCVKELITAVDSKVNEQEKKQRLREVYSRTDSKSIMRMKSGQMFAKEDLIRGRKLLHDGALQLKNSAGRLKDVHAMLLSDVLVFLQEKDQKYVFASLDQRSTVISLQNLIVREVANEERGLFLITAGIERPEMVEVLASSKEDRNTWRAIIQDAMHSMEKDEDEGVPSETEEDRRQHENRAREIRELLRRKDEQIISLLEEKVHIFRDLGDCNPVPNDTNPAVRERMLFRATPDDVTKGEPIIKDAMREVETLHALVNSGVGGAGYSVSVGLVGGSMGPVCLPRRAETFGGFDSHQMNSSKNGEKEEGDESLDLRRTESDSVLKKGATASLQMLLKKSNEVQHSVTNLHSLLISLQAVVVQQDSFIEDQRQALSDRLTANSSRHSSSSSLSSSSSSRPSSLIEQEKHRSLERQRQEAASLQKQQAAHLEEKRRREKVWEMKEKSLSEREEMLRVEEEETRKRRQQLIEEREMLQKRKEEYQRELERLKEAQQRLERDKEALRIDTERLDAMKRDKRFQSHQRSPSTTSEDSIRFRSSGSLDLDSAQATEQPKGQVELSTSAPTKEPFLRIGSKRMGKNFNPFSSSSSSKPQAAEKESQLPTRLLQLAKPKEKKDKKKKKGKGGEQTQSESKVTSDPQNDGDIFFC